MCRRMLVLLHGLLHMKTRGADTEQRLYDYKTWACIGKCQDGSVCASGYFGDKIMASSVIVFSRHVTQHVTGVGKKKKKKGNGQRCRETCCFVCFIVQMQLCGIV